MGSKKKKIQPKSLEQTSNTDTTININQSPKKVVLKKAPNSHQNLKNNHLSKDEPTTPDEKSLDAQNDKQELASQISDNIEQTGSITQSGEKHTIHCLTIVGQIEGHFILPPQNKTTKYEHVIPQLVAIEEDKEIDGLLIILNTVGGDVEAGLAIAELIAGLNKPTVEVVLGGAHSIGIPIAVSADKTFIAKSASMTIHPVRMNGMIIGVHQSFEHFKKIQDRIIDFVVEHSNVSDEQFRSLMLNTGELVSDVGTIINGEEAVSIGLCDEIGTLSEALKCLHTMIDQHDAEPDTE